MLLFDFPFEHRGFHWNLGRGVLRASVYEWAFASWDIAPGTAFVDLKKFVYEVASELAVDASNVRWRTCRSVDGLPWEIHAIEDDQARDAATASYRAAIT